MSDIPDQASERLEPISCPHCDQTTMPNRLADGSLICSCAAERALPVQGAAPGASELPSPQDSPEFGGAGQPGHPELPPDRGQFGRDVATDAFKPLRQPPGRE